MTRAKQLPSGNWRAVAEYKDELGKRKYKSFTAKTEHQANYDAEQFEKKYIYTNMPENMTVEQAIDKYIKSREAVLSPATITGYKRIKKNYFPLLMSVPFKNLTNITIQSEINNDKTHSAKSIHNAVGLLSATLTAYYPEFKINVLLPKKKKVLFQIPSVEETGTILNAIKGTDIEIPVLLAVYLGLRMSEIRGLKHSDVRGGKISIQRAIVDTEIGAFVKDETKNLSSTRTVALPQILKDMLINNNSDVFIVPLTSSMITKRFQSMLENNNLPHFRFHDLRHVNASIMLRLNIPVKYQMQRGGWSTESTLKTTYQHTMADYATEIDNQLYDYIDSLNKTTLHETLHENKKV